jgi:hypothetical protein
MQPAGVVFIARAKLAISGRDHVGVVIQHGAATHQRLASRAVCSAGSPVRINKQLNGDALKDPSPRLAVVQRRCGGTPTAPHP